MAQDQQQVTDALYLGNLDPRVTKRILYDICIQVKGLKATCVLQRLLTAKSTQGHTRRLGLYHP